MGKKAGVRPIDFGKSLPSTGKQTKAFVSSMVGGTKGMHDKNRAALKRTKKDERYDDVVLKETLSKTKVNYFGKKIMCAKVKIVKAKDVKPIEEIRQPRKVPTKNLGFLLSDIK